MIDAEIRMLRYVQRLPAGAQPTLLPGATMLQAFPPTLHSKSASAQEAMEREARLELRIRELERQAVENERRAQQALEQVQEHSAHAQTAALKQQQERLDALWASRIADMSDGFVTARNDYFRDVERQVVRLALGIAARVLHREAQMDPLLLRGPVRVALEELQQQAACVLEVPAGSADAWKHWLETSDAGAAKVEVRACDGVAADHCRLTIDASTADLSTSSQLAEIERGFFDLLQHRPAATAETRL